MPFQLMFILAITLFEIVWSFLLPLAIFSVLFWIGAMWSRSDGDDNSEMIGCAWNGFLVLYCIFWLIFGSSRFLEAMEILLLPVSLICPAP